MGTRGLRVMVGNLFRGGTEPGRCGSQRCKEKSHVIFILEEERRRKGKREKEGERERKGEGGDRIYQ